MSNHAGWVGILAPAVAASFPFLTLAQTQSSFQAEVLSLQLKCEDFWKGPDGVWNSGPAATIGATVFTNNRFGVNNVIVGGVDLASALDKKCGGAAR